MREQNKNIESKINMFVPSLLQRKSECTKYKHSFTFERACQFFESDLKLF